MSHIHGGAPDGHYHDDTQTHVSVNECGQNKHWEFRVGEKLEHRNVHTIHPH